MGGEKKGRATKRKRGGGSGKLTGFFETGVGGGCIAGVIVGICFLGVVFVVAVAAVAIALYTGGSFPIPAALPNPITSMIQRGTPRLDEPDDACKGVHDDALPVSDALGAEHAHGEIAEGEVDGREENVDAECGPAVFAGERLEAGGE